MQQNGTVALEIPDWVKVAEQAAWTPRDSCGEMVYKGKMWLMGGWVNYGVGPRDVWSSADGIHWTEVTPAAEWTHGDLPTSLVFNDKMWMMGGWCGGRLPDASASNQVWSSTDGAHWHCVAENAGWSPRLAAAGVEFQGKMWILGGVERFTDSEPAQLRNDVWCSGDGATWDLVTAQTPWSARAYHGAVVFHDKIWVFGGGNYLKTYLALNDVWNSPDGVNWTQVTNNAPWFPRIWFSAVVCKNRMWILGGWSNTPVSRNWNDVWHSTDGENWTQLKTKTIWSERHEQSVYVLDDNLWLVGGMAWPLVNDVWRLNLPDGWPSKS